MSGGFFDYDQYKIEEIKTKLEETLENRKDLEPKVKRSIEKAIKALGIAYTYAQQIDLFLSGDYNEETFLKELGENLQERYPKTCPKCNSEKLYFVEMQNIFCTSCSSNFSKTK